MRPIIVASSQRDCFTPDQLRALLGAAEGDMKTLILLGYYTGARLGDCANMRWDQVNFAQVVIDFTPQKTRTKRIVVPIHPDLLASFFFP
jgi:integrase